MRGRRIGTRGSPLALWQAKQVASEIQKLGAPSPELITISTSGDRLTTSSWPITNGKRLFVKEIEEALLANEIDLAVHSAKDLPAQLPDGLRINAVLPREDPRDALVFSTTVETTIGNSAAIFSGNTINGKIGTSSVRRTAQLIHACPELTILPIRGNVGTRLRKLDEGMFDAVVLAAAGLVRLGMTHRINTRLPTSMCVPAPGQGILAVETRVDDQATHELLKSFEDPACAQRFDAERALVRSLGADCGVALGAISNISGTEISLLTTVGAPDGSRLIRHKETGALENAAAVGRCAAEALLSKGAEELLALTNKS